MPLPHMLTALLACDPTGGNKEESGGGTDVESAASARPIGVAAAGPARGTGTGGGRAALASQQPGGGLWTAWEAQQREVEK